jgi:hypothetical protein
MEKVIIILLVIVILFFHKSKFTEITLIPNKYYLWIILNNISLSSTEIYNFVKNINDTQNNYLAQLKDTLRTKINSNLITINLGTANNYKTKDLSQLKILKSNLSSSTSLFTIFCNIEYFKNINKLTIGKTMDQNIAIMKA